MSEEARETWYVLKDGTAVRPGDVTTGKDGVMRTKSGGEVAVGDHGNPLTRSVPVAGAKASKAKVADNADDGDETNKKAAAESEDAGKPVKPLTTKDMQPDGKQVPYKTRDSKAR